MAKKKSNNFIEVFSIFFSSIKTYFLYLDQCFKYLAFPILGQVIGAMLILACTYYFITNEASIRSLAPFLEPDKNYLILMGIVLLPFLIIFTKAVYDYVIAFSALNILFYTVSNKKKVKDIDFNANKGVIQRRLFKYIILMLILTIILFVPPLIFVAPIAWIFLCLSFQVFALEPDVSAAGALSRSVELVKGNVIPTIILLLLCFTTTYMFFPAVFIWAADKISVTSCLARTFEQYINLMPIEELNTLLSQFNFSVDSIMLSQETAKLIISTLVICFTLPFRNCCFTNLYRTYDSGKIKDYSKESEEIIQRATNKKRKN